MNLGSLRHSRALDIALVVAALAVVGWRAWPQVAAALGTGGAHTAAPALAVRSLRGDTLSLAGLRGKVVLVNFWATWCPPCRAEMPGFQHVYEARKGSGLVVLGLATDDGSQVPVSVFLVEHGITYPVAMSTLETERLFGGVNAIPTTFVIDRAGRIRYQVRGMFARPTLERTVDHLLAEPGS